MAPKSPQSLTIDAEEDLSIALSPGEQEDAEAGPTRYELFTYPADFTLEVLHQKLEAGEIAIPPMQRQFVWNQKQASRLIESFLLGLPVPPIFIYAEKGSETLMVVDGQQRLKSIRYFFDGTFGEEQHGKKIVFRLHLQDKSPFHGKTFEDLKDEDKRLLKRQVLRAFVMKQVNPNDNGSIFHVFERLNTGGTQLTAQEVRNCVNSGPFNDMLHAINQTPSWRKLLGKQFPDRRLRDIELILRVFALLDNEDDYSKPMKEFLTDFLVKERSGARNKYFQDLFITNSDAIFASLGEKPFHVKAGLNAAVLDSVFLAFASTSSSIPTDVAERFKSLTEHQRFHTLTSGSTTDVENVHERIKLAKEHLFGTPSHGSPTIN